MTMTYIEQKQQNLKFSKDRSTKIDIEKEEPSWLLYNIAESRAEIERIDNEMKVESRISIRDVLKEHKNVIEGWIKKLEDEMSRQIEIITSMNLTKTSFKKILSSSTELIEMMNRFASSPSSPSARTSKWLDQTTDFKKRVDDEILARAKKCGMEM